MRAAQSRLSAVFIRPAGRTSDQCHDLRDKRRLAIDRRCVTLAPMAIFAIFVLGIANFALHRAVIESGHPMLAQVPWFATQGGRRVALGLEFIVLLAAMLMAANGFPGLAWGYLIYTMLNGVSAWLVLSGRV